MLTRSMALDLSKFDIRVNSVSPTWTWTPEVSCFYITLLLNLDCSFMFWNWISSLQVAKVAPSGDRQKLREIVSNFHMLRRECNTSEVAAIITFLSSR